MRASPRHASSSSTTRTPFTVSLSSLATLPVSSTLPFSTRMISNLLKCRARYSLRIDAFTLRSPASLWTGTTRLASGITSHPPSRRQAK